MVAKVEISELPEFDAAEYLETPEDIAVYLSAMLEDGDASVLAAALGTIARARGMTDIAKATGLTREALYKALRPDAQPRLETVVRVCHALGVKLVAQPEAAEAEIRRTSAKEAKLHHHDIGVFAMTQSKSSAERKPPSKKRAKPRQTTPKGVIRA